MSAPASIREVVEHGLCIGCGLCASVTRGRVGMKLTSYGALRPDSVDAFTPEEEAQLLAACPGSVVTVPDRGAPCVDPVWGRYFSLEEAWAGDAHVRHLGATGGVLTALALQLVASGEVSFVLHVAASEKHPLVNDSVISDSPERIVAGSGSRYAPTAPLTRFHQALDRDEPFAVVAKPCDLSAIHALASTDERIDQLCRFRLAMVCGGQSRLTKTHALLREFSVDVEDLKSIRYRGNGNPGPTVVETRNGDTHSTSYNELWSDQSSWDLESRCSVCPDALGEAADIAAADMWPGGDPLGEDEGFNALVIRSSRGQKLVDAAMRAGTLAGPDTITSDKPSGSNATHQGNVNNEAMPDAVAERVSIAALNHYQPHQVKKKHALKARLCALQTHQKPVPRISGLRLEQLDQSLSAAQRKSTLAGTQRRVSAGRYSETVEVTAVESSSK